MEADPARRPAIITNVERRGPMAFVVTLYCRICETSGNSTFPDKGLADLAAERFKARHKHGKK